VSCPSGESLCIGTITLQTLKAVRAGRYRAKHIAVFARGSFKLAGGQTVTVRLRLSALARALLAHSHSLRAQAGIVAHDGAGATYSTRTLVTIVTGRAPAAAGRKA
jgi:hypothetical protein